MSLSRVLAVIVTIGWATVFIAPQINPSGGMKVLPGGAPAGPPFAPPSVQPKSTDPSTVISKFNLKSLVAKTGRGLEVDVSEGRAKALAGRIVSSLMQKAISQGKAKAKLLEDKMTTLFQKRAVNVTLQNGKDEAIGPHFITDKKVTDAGFIGDRFLEATEIIKQELNLKKEDAQVLKYVNLVVMEAALECTYDDPITCDPHAEYRTFDGTCNNLHHPVWGSAVTPFERFLFPKYEDGFGDSRITGIGSGLTLPNARRISTEYHQASTPADLQLEVAHLTMEFGQIVSHDVNRNALTRNTDGSRLPCCLADGTINPDPEVMELGCEAVRIPDDDPFFDRECLSFNRALGGPDLQCNIGTREQINQVTHWLEGSVFYGSDETTAMSIRKLTGGLLSTFPGPDGELMPQNLGGGGCRIPPGGPLFCFRSGDVRANQNPPLVALHTLFVREHNRVALQLASLNPTWVDDEKLYQETRRIVVAEYQHITYKEYLAVLLSTPLANAFGFAPKATGYHHGYNHLIQPGIRNGFMTSGFRSGHSNIDSTFGTGLLFKEHFLDPSVVYDPAIGIDGLTSNLASAPQQKLDRLKTDQMTNHLFERVTVPKSGGDLASRNIMRGRDHGTPSYNDFRVLCGLPRAFHFFPVAGGLIHHTWSSAFRLFAIYGNIDDVEAWTAISSELPLTGGVFGPTASCLTGLQFYFLKNGDRFFYENDQPYVKFTPAQLDQIRKTSLSRVICDNTGLTTIQPESLRSESASNPKVSCASLPSVDLTPWQESDCVDGGWSDWSPWTTCYGFFRFRFRFCNSPAPNHCGAPCEGSPFQVGYCFPGSDKSRQNSKEAEAVARKVAPPGVFIDTK